MPMKTLCLVLIMLLPPCSLRAEPSPLVFGLPASASHHTVLNAWQPLLEDMSAAIGVTVRGQVYDDYAGIIWAMGAGETHLAWLGNKGGIEAVDRSSGEVGLQIVNAQGMNGYYAHLIARKDSPLSTVEDMFAHARELTFGNGDPNSTSGFLIPAYYLFALRGLNAKDVFKRVTQSSHEENFLAVAEGRTDVATSNSADMERFQQRFPEKFKRIRIIWSSPLIPSDPIVWRRNLPAATKEAIRRFLSEYGHPGHDKTEPQLQREHHVLTGLNWSGFKPSDNSQLLPIRKLDLFKERITTQNNTSLSQAERNKRMQTIEAELKALEHGQ